MNDQCVCCKNFEFEYWEEPCKSCCHGSGEDDMVSKFDPIEDEPVEQDGYDPVNRPEHYCQGGMETIDEMILLFGKNVVMDFCLCNAWKYRARAMYKNGEEDMKKAAWYLNKYKELKGGEPDGWNPF